MKAFREWLREEEEKIKELTEMSPMYTPQETGLKEYIWVSTKRASHGPRIKVYEYSKGPNFSVTIEDNPRVVAGKSFVNAREFKEICKFIIKHKDDLIGYWNSELTEDELDNVLILKKGDIK